MASRKELPRGVWAANEVEDIVKRNAEWATRFVVDMTRALLRDGRPLFTEQIPQKQQLDMLTQADPQWWASLQQASPEKQAELAAMMVRARASGQLPQPINPELPPEAPEIMTEREESLLDQQYSG